MSGGGQQPGERRGGRPRGSAIAAEIRAGRIAAGIAAPVMGLEKMEYLLTVALRHMEEAWKAQNLEEYAAWYAST
jgi:hypothetical protein